MQIGWGHQVELSTYLWPDGDGVLTLQSHLEQPDPRGFVPLLGMVLLALILSDA